MNGASIVVVRELKNRFRPRPVREVLSARASSHARVLRADNSGRQVHRGQVETSLRSLSHLASNQQIDLTPMVFIVGEALVNLSLGEIWKTLRGQRIDRL